MMRDAVALEALAQRLGIPAEAAEQVAVLAALLREIRSHEAIGDRIALKGGTALNAFHDDLPRFSRDIDLNVIGDFGGEDVQAAGAEVGRALEQVCRRCGIEVRKRPSPAYPEGKWRGQYRSVLTMRHRNVEFDVAWRTRVPLWPIEHHDSRVDGLLLVTRMPLVSLSELVAGKSLAYLARTESRDVFDLARLSRRRDIDVRRVRLALLVLGGAARTAGFELRRATAGAQRFEPSRVANDLAQIVARRGDVEGTTPESAARLVRECDGFLAQFLALQPSEVEWIERLERGEIRPELVTDDPVLRDRIARNPGLLWAARRATELRGRQEQSPET